MKRALRKDSIREIRRNPGRFISIFFIIALGAAFFTGIRSTKYDMKYSADLYYNSANLMDIRVLSDLGLTDDDLEALRQVEGVSLAEGNYTAEAICEQSNEEYVVSLISLTEDINRPEIRQGRMPEAEDRRYNSVPQRNRYVYFRHTDPRRLYDRGYRGLTPLYGSGTGQCGNRGRNDRWICFA